MRVAFVCVGSPFTPTMLYKENLFIRAAVESGHEVLVVASDRSYLSGELHRSNGPTTTTEEGYVLVRYPAPRGIPRRVNEKLRVFPQMLDDLLSFDPQLVYFNVPQIHGLRYVKKLRERNSKIRVVCHYSTTFDNSGAGVVSRRLLHGVIYRRWIARAGPHIDSSYYISPESEQFLTDVYRLPAEELELIPLPGQVLNPVVRANCRVQFRQAHGIPEDEIVFLHSGKMNKQKETLALLRLFSDTSATSARLLLAGSLSTEIKDEAERLILEDGRVTHLGFLDGAQLTHALCAADLYLQPGSASQTAQTALCCGTPVVTRDLPIYRELITSGGVLIQSRAELRSVMNDALAHPDYLQRLSAEAHALAADRLDYQALFKQLLQGELSRCPADLKSTPDHP